jgi:hypothetical protein
LYAERHVRFAEYVSAGPGLTLPTSKDVFSGTFEAENDPFAGIPMHP